MNTLSFVIIVVISVIWSMKKERRFVLGDIIARIVFCVVFSYLLSQILG